MDTLGLLTELAVTAADVPDREGARLLLRGAGARRPRLRRVWVDGAYTGDLLAWAEEREGVTLEVVSRPAHQDGFVALPRRWVVERSFAWYCRNRRLSKDYEYFAMYSASWVYLASIQLMLRRLAATPDDLSSAA